MGKIAGSIFTVHPIILRNFKIKGNLTIAVLDLTEIEQKEMKDKTVITSYSIHYTKLYDNIRSILREINLNEARLNLAEEELEFSRINRKNGTSSGSDFWKKQIEVQNLKDSILENRETLTYKLKIFCDNLKIPDNYFIDSFIQEDLPQLPEIPPNKSNYQNLKTQLKLIEFEKDKLQVDIERKKYASQLTASFSLNPQYGERDNNVITSYSIHYTKLYESWPSKKNKKEKIVKCNQGEKLWFKHYSLKILEV